MAFEFLAPVIGHSGGESFELRLNLDLVVRGNSSFQRIRKLAGRNEKKSGSNQEAGQEDMPEGHGSSDNGPKWHSPPCSEISAQKKSFRLQRRGLL